MNDLLEGGAAQAEQTMQAGGPEQTEQPMQATDATRRVPYDERAIEEDNLGLPIQLASVSLEEAGKTRETTLCLAIGRGSSAIGEGSIVIRWGSPVIRDGRPAIRRGRPTARRGSQVTRRGSSAVSKGSPETRWGSLAVSKEALEVMGESSTIKRENLPIKRESPEVQAGISVVIPNLRRTRRRLGLGQLSSRPVIKETERAKLEVIEISSDEETDDDVNAGNAEGDSCGVRDSKKILEGVGEAPMGVQGLSNMENSEAGLGQQSDEEVVHLGFMGLKSRHPDKEM
ncbi:hypothetical protein FGG08_003755 [Glutinoglossum americanum]|uniref:Uncharacterized protein n=1 Tax=Glutinoglossum americanum TaxID=1670608 RepID=A0A9P8I1W0_9PEZI|nr:hypothetical protein FGG08_003755 [Glutinoglossum americanum]